MLSSDVGNNEAQQQHSLPTFMTLQAADIAQAATVVQKMYDPRTSPNISQELQKDLFDLQRKPEAWGLIVPFVGSNDPQVQFFGAHTAQIKIARDWDQWPISHAQALRDLLLSVLSHATTHSVGRIVIRKLSVAITSLALRISPLEKSLWPDWIKDVLTLLISPSANPEAAPDFLSIAIEEVRSADLLPPAKTRINASVRAHVPLVSGLLNTRIQPRPDVSVHSRIAWLKAAEAWASSSLPGDELSSLVSVLIRLLPIRESFVATSDVLQEIMSKSALSSGKGTKILTIPVLEWVSSEGKLILQESLTAGISDDTSHAFCKLLLALGEHSSDYLVSHMDDLAVQTFLQVVLGYTAFPGWYGADETESEMTLQFWSGFQDVIIDADFSEDRSGSTWGIIKSVDLEVATALTRKIRWPTMQEGSSGWPKDQRDTFQNFRRDAGDTLLNTYYVLRNDLFERFLPDLLPLIQTPGSGTWESVEALLYAFKSVQEAVPTSANPHLSIIFGPEVLGRLPTRGDDQIRKTALDLCGAYSTWFHDQPGTDLLMNAMAYVVGAFAEPALSLHAAKALRDLCENNRRALSGHIDSFSNLYANLSSIPDTEKAKVLQAISSVIQALPLEEAIGPVEGVVTPLVNSLAGTLSVRPQASEESRTACVAHLQAISACAKGLTNSADFTVELSTDEEDRERILKMENARADLRMVALRDRILEAVRVTMSLWSSDAEVGEAISELIKAITSLPVDNTLISLPPAPVLELICAAAHRNITAVWLSLSTMLFSQLHSASSSLLRPSSAADNEASRAVALPASRALVECTLKFLSTPSAMEDNPDIVRAFFVYLMTVAGSYPEAIVQLPDDLRSGVMDCAIKGLTLQERYSLVDSARFLHAIGRKTLSGSIYADQSKTMFRSHGMTLIGVIIGGIAGASPRSSMPNLVELLALLIAKIPECRTWVKDVLYSPQFSNPRLTREVKDKFIYGVTSSRSNRQTSEAANEFSLIARGLEGSSFGYASMSN